MVLEQINIVNFRSCQKLSVLLDSSIPNIFIGLNDCGKSTILKSIDLLLGDKPIYNFLDEGQFKSDLSNSPIKKEEFDSFLSELALPILEYSKNETIVIGKLSFSDAEAENLKTLTLSNSLAWCIENAQENHFWVAKKYYKGSSQVFILTKDSSDSDKLWEMTAADLKKYMKAEQVTDDDIQNENGKGRFSNMEKIRACYSGKELVPIWSPFKGAKSDKVIFPEFKYFDWNCSFEDINALANSIMKEHIDIQLAPLKDSALKAAEEAEKEINKKFGELSEVIQSVAKGVEKINSKVHFDVKEKISDIMVQKTNSDGFIHLENQGEGLKRQIWFSLIKSKAETASEDDYNKYIWAFDEPETHLFPLAQREFFDILSSISKNNVQTLISTHSTIFIDKSKISKISSVSQNSDGYTITNKCTDVDSIHSSLTVKNSDFLFYDKFLIVEGDTEQYLIPKLFELYTGSTLIEKNIQLVNIQGKDKWTMNKGIIDKVMTGFKKPIEHVVYLFDNDFSHEIGSSAITENMFFVGEQDIEDSLDSQVWLSILNDFFDKKISFNISDINEFKEAVAKGKNVSSNQKFYKILYKNMRRKWEEAGLKIDDLINIPSKGSESADFIFSGITKKDLIPKKIQEAFQKILE